MRARRSPLAGLRPPTANEQEWQRAERLQREARFAGWLVVFSAVPVAVWCLAQVGAA